MSEFLRACLDYPFLARAVGAALLAAVLCGTVGTLAVVRRSTYVAGAVSHSVLAGIGFARFAAHAWGWTWLTPTGGAFAAAALAAAILSGSSRRGGATRPDTVLSLLWTVGMAAGLAFMSAVPGYQEDLMGYLFGNILLVTPGDLAWMAALAATAVGATALLWRHVLAVAFQRDLARVRGVPTRAVDLLLALLEAFSVVLLARIVGVVLVIALLAIPAATAGLAARRLAPMMVLAAALCATTTLGGLALSYGPDWPVGPAIVLLSAGLYVAVLALRALGFPRGRGPFRAARGAAGASACSPNRHSRVTGGTLRP